MTVRVLCRWANKQASLIDEQQRETQLNKAKEALVRVTGPNVRKTLLENPDVKPFVDAHDLLGTDRHDPVVAHRTTEFGDEVQS